MQTYKSIFNHTFFSSQSRLLHWYDFHALLHNGLLSILRCKTSIKLTATKVFINNKTVDYKPVNYDCDSAHCVLC